MFTIKTRENSRMQKNRAHDVDSMSGLIGTKWKAGMNAPFDPIAAKKQKN